MKPADFIAAIGPAAQASAKASGVPASVTVAQAALESAWGESKLARFGHNLFGVKADAAWKGEVLTMQTREFQAGKWITIPANWRKYADWLECINDHAAFLRKNKRYSIALATTTAEAFARALQTAGYATDPEYGKKLVAVMRSHNLAALDT